MKDDTTRTATAAVRNKFSILSSWQDGNLVTIWSGASVLFREERSDLSEQRAGELTAAALAVAAEDEWTQLRNMASQITARGAPINIFLKAAEATTERYGTVNAVLIKASGAQWLQEDMAQVRRAGLPNGWKTLF